MFYGGYEGATRLMMGAGAEEELFPIAALEFTYKAEFDLRHRDFLGALTAQGIRRETVGDILTGQGRTVVFVREEIAPYLLTEVDQIGRVGVKVGYADINDLPVPNDIEELVWTLSSLRLDAFVACAAHLSREKAARLIKSEMVTVDHVTVTEVSKMLKDGLIAVYDNSDKKTVYERTELGTEILMTEIVRLRTVYNDIEKVYGKEETA